MPLLRALPALLLLLCAPLYNAVAASQPAIIAHRGGTADAPENTVPAIRSALANGVDAVWITLQLSKDGVVVLYRPADLQALTNARGPVSAYSAAQLAQTDAGWAYTRGDEHPFRAQGIGIPRLATVLQTFPHATFYLDIKSPDADPARFADALLTTLEEQHALARTRVYSTDARYLQALPPQIARFVSRDETRSLLANVAMAHRCQLQPHDATPRWYGLELTREVEVVEKYTLGEGRSKAQLSWDEESMACFRSQGPARIVLFGINSPEAYQQAQTLGADAVMVDSPEQAQQWRKMNRDTASRAPE
ncbi:glycerophosphodiester phosphodiesterase family protein [Serratia rubidaea]|uniref:Glycerophosphoryl diester phosphodiesterase n=1 Tax=Serratia rubidaea TaxID=61652 RepID=A0A448S1Q7_SERRU|nr:glycerophosphodiester phosphodiesterase family protein [Serratia rubidaea]VEI61625.1 Glycerophosphoryl diester phosphodiesterase [Serratia rubidaea]